MKALKTRPAPKHEGLIILDLKCADPFQSIPPKMADNHKRNLKYHKLFHGILFLEKSD